MVKTICSGVMWLGLEQLYTVPRKTAKQGSYGLLLRNHKLGSLCLWQVVVVKEATC